MTNPSIRFHLGEILWIDFPHRVPPGHEQLGRRPGVVVGLPEQVQSIPYRVLIIVPLTRTRLSGPLFPHLSARTGGLPSNSTALIYQVGAIDAQRVVGRLGQLSEAERLPLEIGLRQLFGLNASK